ncbi:MAG: thiamine phosphate synthase [Candidatus Micrarchaeota archaeon]|nr:thiamine phosphate synthase [Candidatus Micrarchaeota archaeon]
MILNEEISNLTSVDQVKMLVDKGIELQFIQYRVRNKSFYEMAKDVDKIIRLMENSKISTKLIINDYLKLATDHAHGLHIGVNDVHYVHAISEIENRGREIVRADHLHCSLYDSRNFFLGISANSYDKVIEYNSTVFANKIAYIGLGPVGYSKFMSHITPIGLSTAKQAIQSSEIPIVFIGGLRQFSLYDLFCEPVPNGIALMSAVIKQNELDISVLNTFIKLYNTIEKPKKKVDLYDNE